MKYVGKGYPIQDAEAKATGAAVYAGDISLNGMLYMALLTSDKSHAIVKKIDCEEAEVVPGVVSILHCFNTTDKKFSRYKRTAKINVPEQERVFTDHVRFVGDRIGAVLATDPFTAKSAVKKIIVDYEELPHAFSVEDAQSGVIDGMHPEGIAYSCVVGYGEKPPMQACDVAVSTEIHLDRVSHIAMENHACTADYDRAIGVVTVWSPNQSVYGMRYVVANFLGLPFSKVRVIKTTMGGSFGGKQECILEPVVALAAYMLKRPVCLSLTRDQSMLSTLCRAPIDAVTHAVFSATGKIKSIAMDTTLDAGAYLGCSLAYVKTLGTNTVRNYHFPYLNYHGKTVCTNMPVSGGYRGWSSPECASIMEFMMDRAAEKLEIDPIELRLMNVVTPEDCDPLTNVPFDRTQIRVCLTHGREAFHWDERRKNAERSVADRYRIGVGMACSGHVNGNFPGQVDFSVVNMRLNEDGSVVVNATLHDHGCGTVRLMQIITAEVLGIEPALIQIQEGDTFITPEDVGCYASRSTHVIGAAVEKCARALVESILEKASRILDVPLGKLSFAEGAVSSEADSAIRLNLFEIAREAHYTLQESIDVTVQHKSNSNPGVHGAHFAQVKVDCYTGMVQVMDYLAVHDIGRAINPDICKAQIQGAVQMGCGIALTETMTHKNPETGKAVSSLRDYHVMNAFDSANVEMMLIEEPSAFGPFGAKSIGEVAFVPVTAAIVSAVNHALGSDLHSIPLTPDKVLTWLNQKAQDQ